MVALSIYFVSIKDDCCLSRLQALLELASSQLPKIWAGTMEQVSRTVIGAQNNIVPGVWSGAQSPSRPSRLFLSYSVPLTRTEEHEGPGRAALVLEPKVRWVFRAGALLGSLLVSSRGRCFSSCCVCGEVLFWCSQEAAVPPAVVYGVCVCGSSHGHL